MNYEYPPLKRSQYELQGMPNCEVAQMGNMFKGGAIWNLFWLSIPAIDTVPGSGLNWWKNYVPVVNASSSIIADVLGEEVLYRKLLMHPVAFMSWFEREDLSIYDTYDVLDGEKWRDVVLSRAMTVVDRLRMMDEPVIGRSRNVVYANFGQKRA